MRYFGVVSYSGENYFGFQRQVDQPTIQDELETRISSLCNAPITIHGAGRTDAGVHALGQTFSFEADIADLDAFLKALNRMLPEDIYVRSLRVVPSDFDARHSCVGKVYQYEFTVDRRDPLRSRKIAQLRRNDFKLEPFLQALMLFSGKHDFRNFTTKPEDNKNFIRDVQIDEPRIDDDGNHVVLTFRSDGFMRYQIRMMVGAALRVGVSRMSLDDIRQALDTQQRKIVPFKAPAEGLTLTEVLYDETAFL